MNRYLILMLLLGLSPVLAQDSEAEDTTEAEEVAAEEESADELEDDFELDMQSDHTEDDEDVFEASVDVSYQQSVPFPTDI
ncbi:MAG: hypothetical protein AAFN50_08005 [Pseudomonadota bacterium]